MKQQSLASQGVFEKYGRKSRRELFLDEMEVVVPWSAMESVVRPHPAPLLSQQMSATSSKSPKEHQLQVFLDDRSC